MDDINCWKCNAYYKIDMAKVAGKHLKCKKCDAIIIIPTKTFEEMDKLRVKTEIEKALELRRTEEEEKDKILLKNEEEGKKWYFNNFNEDGSHKKLVECIKRHLHDPSSYEHADTRITNIDFFDDFLKVKSLKIEMQYRAKNEYGATVLYPWIKAEVSMNGDILKIKAESSDDDNNNTSFFVMFPLQF